MLATIRVGEGPRPAVLIHGFLGSGRNLASFARRWTEIDPQLSFLLPDLPGHGASRAIGDDHGLADIARDVLATARAQGCEGPLHWVGHSFGGRVSLAASLVVPEAVRDVTLLDIGPGPIPHRTSESAQVLDQLIAAPAHVPDRDTMRQFLLSRGIKPGVTEWLLMNLVHTDEGYVWRIDRDALAGLHERVLSEDLWAAIERPGAQVRCVRGESSRYVTDADKARLERAGCPVATLAGSGHFVHVDAPDRLLQLVTGQIPWA
jgi:esterase